MPPELADGEVEWKRNRSTKYVKLDVSKQEVRRRRLMPIRTRVGMDE